MSHHVTIQLPPTRLSLRRRLRYVYMSCLWSLPYCSGAFRGWHRKGPGSQRRLSRPVVSPVVLLAKPNARPGAEEAWKRERTALPEAPAKPLLAATPMRDSRSGSSSRGRIERNARTAALVVWQERLHFLLQPFLALPEVSTDSFRPLPCCQMTPPGSMTLP